MSDFPGHDRRFAVQQCDAAFVLAITNHRHTVDRLSRERLQIDFQLKPHVGLADRGLRLDRQTQIFVIKRRERGLKTIVLQDA